MLPLIQNGRVKDLGEESLVMHQFFLQPSDDIAAHHDMDLRERLLDHLAKCQARQQLHLRADGNPDHIRLLFRHLRHDQLIAEIPIDVHLLILQTGKYFFRDAGTIAEIAFHRIEDERGRIVGGGDIGHRLAEGIERPFQRLRLIEPLATHDRAWHLQPAPPDRTHRRP